MHVHTFFFCMCCTICSVWVICGIWFFNLRDKNQFKTHRVVEKWGKCPIIKNKQFWEALSSIWKDCLRNAALPEFLLRQVELHKLIFLVLFVQPGDDCFCLLVARLFHKGLDILLENPQELWKQSWHGPMPEFQAQWFNIKHLSWFYVSSV